MPNYATLKPTASLTLEAWVNPVNLGDWNKIIGLDYRADGSWNGPYLAYALESNQGSQFITMHITSSGNQFYYSTQDQIPLNSWSHVVGTYDGSKMVLYVNGNQSESAAQTGTIDYGTSQEITIGARSPYSIYSEEGWNGKIEEVRISSIARPAEWIATEYNNQSTPTSFFTLSGESSVGIIPSAVVLRASESQTFSISNFCGGVSWSMPSTAPGSLTADGTYTAPSSISSEQSFAISASDSATGIQLGTATVSLAFLKTNISVAISPTSATLVGGQTDQFSATVANSSNTDVTWSVSPSGVGTISGSGLYVAPSVVTSAQTVTVTATSTEDTSKSATATINLVPLSISVAPTIASLYGGESVTIVATVSNCNSSCNVTWSSVNTNDGFLKAYSSSSVYYAPISISEQRTVTFTATSVQDPTKSASVTITLLPPVVTVSPASHVLYSGQTQQFTATVTGGNDSSVSWSISPAGSGGISSTGLYKAPLNVSTEQTVTVTATSDVATSIHGSAVVTLMPSQCASSGYQYRRTITVNHALVANSDATNFPLYVSLTDQTLATQANGGHVINANGYDIIFTSDAEGLYQLDHELVGYDPATGNIAAWVRIPSVSASTDTTVYMYYGNSQITTSLQSTSGVWNSNYQAVYHLGNVTSGVLPDSTSNQANGISFNLTQVSTDHAASFDGSTSYAQIPGSLYTEFPLENNSSSSFTSEFSVWFKTTSYGVVLDQVSGASAPDGAWAGGNMPAVEVDSNGNVVQSYLNGCKWWGFGECIMDTSYNPVASSTAVNDGTWHNAVSSISSETQNLYLDGVLVSSGTNLPSGFASEYNYYIGAGWQSWFWMYNQPYFNGEMRDVEISTTPHSADWILTSYRNQSSPSTFLTIGNEMSYGGMAVSPSSVNLYASQNQQFSVAQAASCGATSALWTLEPGAPGTLTSSGLYTAPDSIAAASTVTVSATSYGATSSTVTATIHLLPKLAISIAPQSVILTNGQSQQFTATVSNAVDSSVTWTISPSGSGTISTAGLYIAPATIADLSSVVVTATSKQDTTQYASAVITLSPTSNSGSSAGSSCGANGYSRQRTIVIDHTKVKSTDLANYPFLFNSTDSDLATVANGGQVTSSSGYDIYFSLDSNGQNRLDHEVESYNPATGQLIAWVRIPTLSHTTDTVVYMFYGNSNVISSLQNSSGVWDSNYEAVYHLADAAVSGALDSTANAYHATVVNFTDNSGQIDGGATLDGSTSYLEIPNTAFPSYPLGDSSNTGIAADQSSTAFSATYEIWFKTSSWGGLLDQTDGETCDEIFGYCVMSYPTKPGDLPYTTWGGMLDIDWDGTISGRGIGSTSAKYNDNQWHSAAITFANGNNNLYVDGQLAGVGQGATYGFADSSYGYAYFVGAVDVESDTSTLDARPWKYLDGSLDEIKVSRTARSSEWIATEFNNQNWPATFYSFLPLSTIAVVPAKTSLYASQTQQFAVAGKCSDSVLWSMSSSGQGTMSSAGLYTAPQTVSAKQSVTVTAENVTDNSVIGSVVVNLLPAPAPISLVADATSPYTVGTAQEFTATVLDENGDGVSSVKVTFNVNGANPYILEATSDSNGIASVSYTGTNSGSDSIQATAELNGVLQESNTVNVSWVTPSAAVTVATLTLQDQSTVGTGGLIGAFTDKNGSVIEPVVIGATSKTLIVPNGATQFQLGVDDTYYEDNGGAGLTVSVNGTAYKIPATTMPWKWVTGGLNNLYQYSMGDGTSPVVVSGSLNVGDTLTVTYVSGSVSTGYGSSSLVTAAGDQTAITGAAINKGLYYPTLYTSTSAYPTGQPVTYSAIAIDANNAPISGITVQFTVSGANPGQYEAVSDSNGIATIVYIGTNDGTDTIQAQTSTASAGTMSSGQESITWTTYPTPPTVGTLSLTKILNNIDVEAFSAYPRDASGNVLSGVKVGYYMSGIEAQQTSVTSSDIGEAYVAFYHTATGDYKVVAVDSEGRNVQVAPAYSAYWTMHSSTETGSSGQLTMSISGLTSVVMPNSLTLTGTVTDSLGLTPAVYWTQVSGPGTATFSAPLQTSTSVSFDEVGTYVLQLNAQDTTSSGSVQFTVTVSERSVSAQTQGWIGSPAYNSAVSGVVPIMLASGVTLQSGTLVYYPVRDPNNITTLNANTVGSGQIGILDTTKLSNDAYVIMLQGTDASGDSQYSLSLVTVTGNYKPGRVTSTVTDLVVPANGLSIQIQRDYDSLNASKISDFGYGWSLGLNTDLAVDSAFNVTFTLGGQRKTFYFTPQMPPCTAIGCLYPWYYPSYTPEPGLNGTLTDAGSGCAVFDYLGQDGSTWACKYDGTYFKPTTYVYTDPNGTAYTISANGSLQSIADRSGNGLTITSAGITSTSGINVPFVRDSQNRITQITDPQGNIYQYGYDAAGNLATVTYPGVTQSSTYTYGDNHYYLSGSDFRSNPLPTTTYFDSNDTDPNGLSLDGRLKSVTNALGQTTSYAYDLVNQITTTTWPADASGNTGKSVMTYDSYGDLLSSVDPLGHTTTNVYDANHNMTSTTDTLGHTTAYTYDNNGNKTSTTYPATASSSNTTSTTAYNEYSEPTSTTDELGNVRAFNYDDSYNPLTVTDGLGTLMSTSFNTSGQMLSGAIGYDITTAPARASVFTYDANGNLASKTDALGRTTSYTYNSLGQKLTTVQPALSGYSTSALTTTYSYDAFGHLLQTSAPLSQTTSSTWDANGNKLTDTDARGNTTSYQYDALNRLILTTYADGTTSSRTYDYRGNVIDETDQGGHVTHHVYDLAGRQISVTLAYGSSAASTTSYAYDDAGRKVSETDALGNTTSYQYDTAGNLLALSGAKGTFTYTYDDARNQLSMTDGNGNTTNYSYDARKRLLKTTYPDGTTKTNTYDGPGNLASVTDQAGNVVQYTYDAANQLASVVQTSSPSSANTTIYGYDANGNPITFEDANQHTTVNAFDPLGRITTKTLPDGSLTESRQYDAAGNLTALTHFNGVTTSYTYDALNRLLSRTTPGEAVVSHTYTATGQYASTTDSLGTTTYSYDSQDRIVAKVTPIGTLSYTYDAAGHVGSIASSNANGASVSYTYDSLNRLSTVTDNRTGGVTSYSYDSASNVATVMYPNGVQSSFTYDTLNRVSGLASQQASYSYQRGAIGNLTSASESTGRAVSWSYDGINRLTGETITLDPAKKNGSVRYSLDPVGNRLSLSSSLDGVSTASGSFNADDELVGEGYDSNGNVTSTNGNLFAYNSQNQLVSMNGGAVKLWYDAFGNRVAKSASGITTQYLVEDDKNPTGLPQVFEELTNGVVSRTYTYGLQRISEEQVVDKQWTVSYYSYDGGGSVRQLTNVAGVVTDTYEYDAFGNTLTTTGSTPNAYLYRGEQYDSDLGLYYLRARYYNPATGRLISRDPYPGSLLASASLHRYNYAAADPVNRIDPSGREDMLAFASITAHMAGTAAFIAPVEAAVACMLNTASRTLEAISNRPVGDLTFAQANLKACTGMAEVAPKTANAPNNPTPSKDCGEIPAKGVLQTGLDALGIIPGEGTVAAAFYGGKEAFQAVQFGVGLVSTGISAAGGDGIGTSLGATGTGIGLLGKYSGLIKGGAELIPVAGQWIAGAATVWDIGSTVYEYGGCKGWWQ